MSDPRITVTVTCAPGVELPASVVAAIRQLDESLDDAFGPEAAGFKDSGDAHLDYFIGATPGSLVGTTLKWTVAGGLERRQEIYSNNLGGGLIS